MNVVKNLSEFLDDESSRTINCEIIKRITPDNDFLIWENTVDRVSFITVFLMGVRLSDDILE